MIKLKQFVDYLKNKELRLFAGVPDSTFSDLFIYLMEDNDIVYIPATREDNALGIASASYFKGNLGVVVMQNSGIGNIINPLTSFNLIYKIPVFLIIGWRGAGGWGSDAPEHWIMGEKTLELLELLGVPYIALKKEEVHDFDLKRLDLLIEKIWKNEIPGAFVVEKGILVK